MLVLVLSIAFFRLGKTEQSVCLFRHTPNIFLQPWLQRKALLRKKKDLYLLLLPVRTEPSLLALPLFEPPKAGVRQDNHIKEKELRGREYSLSFILSLCHSSCSERYSFLRY